MKKKLYLIFCLLFFGLARLSGQTTFDVHFNGFAFLDDHEYDALVPLRKTISGTRTALDFGLNPDSSNHFVVGINALHEFGGVPFFLQVAPVAYYAFNNKHWHFFGGEFPREGLLTQYPRALLNDTLQYYRPNIEGLLLRNDNQYGKETVWLDWLSRQTATNRNQFLAGFFGKFSPVPGRPFYISHFFMFEHDAGTKPLMPDSPIEDNGGAQVRAGLDFSHKTMFDSLSFEIGGMGSAHRQRGLSQFVYAQGFVASFYMSLKKFSLYDEFYKGSPNYIIYGDPFYSKTVYNRVDLKYTAFTYRRLQGSFMFSFHQSPAHFQDYSEVFHLSYDLGRVRLATIDEAKVNKGFL